MKIIFLDIDGVLITPKCYSVGPEKTSGLAANADPNCIAALNAITKSTGTKIVIISTWRLHGLEFVRNKLRSWGVRASVFSVTPFIGGIRGKEIQAWIRDHRYDDLEKFVIIDDEISDMGTLKSFTVQPDKNIGLTMADAKLAIQKLQ